MPNKDLLRDLLWDEVTHIRILKAGSHPSYSFQKNFEIAEFKID
ncbi:MAG: hypothetical protein AAGH40_12225 [Verrucomicrobiota bacterium]